MTRDYAERILALNHEDLICPNPERGRRVTPERVEQAKHVLGVGLGDITTMPINRDPIVAGLNKARKIPR